MPIGSAADTSGPITSEQALAGMLAYGYYLAGALMAGAHPQFLPDHLFDGFAPALAGANHAAGTPAHWLVTPTDRWIVDVPASLRLPKENGPAMPSDPGGDEQQRESSPAVWYRPLHLAGSIGRRASEQGFYRYPATADRRTLL